MQVDKVTQNDLSIFHIDEDQSVFHHLNLTLTNGGRQHLRYLLDKPLTSIKAIVDTQKTIQHLETISDQWPISPTNGTIMVMEKFYESAIDSYPNIPDMFSSYWYQFFHQSDYSLTLFTIQHAIDFFQGMQKIVVLTNKIETN